MGWGGRGGGRESSDRSRDHVYYTTSSGLAGDVQALGLVAGYTATVWGPYEHGMYQVRVGEEEVFAWPMIARTRTEPVVDSRSAPPASVQIETVSDRHIVCFTVPNETLVTRRKGKIAIHGNSKFAGHAVRLGYQGIEFLTTGRLTLPMAEGRDYCLAVRRGEIPLADVVAHISTLEEVLARLAFGTSGLGGKRNLKHGLSLLPEHPDREAIDSLLIEIYEEAWRDLWGLS